MEEETLLIKIPKLEKEEKERIREKLEKIAKKEIEDIMFLKELDEILKNSKITDEDCIRWQEESRKKRLEELKKRGVI